MHAGNPPNRRQSLKPRGIWGGGVHRASYVAASHQLSWEANAGSERELNLGEAGAGQDPPSNPPTWAPWVPVSRGQGTRLAARLRLWGTSKVTGMGGGQSWMAAPGWKLPCPH